MNTTTRLSLAVICLCFAASALQAEVSLPNVFGDHMVLQRGHQNPVWGKADPGEKVTVSIAGQSHATVANAEGTWRVQLTSMEAGGPHRLTVEGKNAIVFEDVLVGEVWVCSGQSNMRWKVKDSNHRDVEIASANLPEMRLITIPNVGTQEPQSNFNGEWKVCSPETVGDFSAVGYFFGRRLHHTLEVPVGLINTAWGGSSIEAWLPRDAMESSGHYDALLEDWGRQMAAYTDEVHAKNVAEYEAWKAAGRPGKTMRQPRDPRTGNHRPANIFNGVLTPIVGYGMRGNIWYQGESNAGRASQYRTLFPLMITTWRELWGQGDFPFYWVQLADYQAEVDVPTGGPWAELREAQTMTRSLPNTGEAVIIDVGEGRDIHPRDKQTVANRLVLHALVKDYGCDMACESPRFASMEIEGGLATLTFDRVSTTLYAFDTKTVKGFTIAGEDQKFVWAEAKIIGKNQVEVWSDQVPEPVAVRYGFEINPVVNLYDRNGLPVTPFRTDDWQGVTAGIEK